jgi:hypothetical protein
LWAAFKGFESELPERWLQVLGAKQKEAECWIVLLTYPVAMAGTIVRPTQLDAGWNAYHFPSPPQAQVELGGHPMDLFPMENLGSPMSEYIHRQIDHYPDHIMRIGRTSASLSGSLSHQREAHHRLLERHYGSGIRDWMDSPM